MMFFVSLYQDISKEYFIQELWVVKIKIYWLKVIFYVHKIRSANNIYRVSSPWLGILKQAHLKSKFIHYNISSGYKSFVTKCSEENGDKRALLMRL